MFLLGSRPACSEGKRMKRLFDTGLGSLFLVAAAGCGQSVEPTETVAAPVSLTADDCPAGTKLIVGAAGDDHLIGTNKADCILGLRGNDIIDGGNGNDWIGNREPVRVPRSRSARPNTTTTSPAVT